MVLFWILLVPISAIAACCIIYQILFNIPNKLEKIDKDMEMLKVHFKEVNIKLDRLSKKLDEKNNV